MLRTALLPMLSFWVACSPAPTNEDSVSPDSSSTDTAIPLDMSRVINKIDYEMQQNDIPGLAAMLVIHDEVVWAEGFGLAQIDNEEPVTKDTPFLLAGVSTTVVSMALMQAVEAGALSLNTDVADLLDFPLDNPHLNGERILVHHLLTHTSGILEHKALWDDESLGLYSEGDSEIGLSQFLESYLVEGGEHYNAETNYGLLPPGEKRVSGRLAPALAAQVLEEATGLNIREHSQKYLFEPLEMSNSGWHLRDLDPARVAMPYAGIAGHREAVAHYGFPDYPSGQLRSSVLDLGKYAAGYLSWSDAEGKRILSEDNVSALFTPPLAGFDDQGLYWRSGEWRGHRYWRQSGGDIGALTDLRIFPQAGFAIAVLINSNDSLAWHGIFHIQRELIKKAEKLLDL